MPRIPDIAQIDGSIADVSIGGTTAGRDVLAACELIGERPDIRAVVLAITGEAVFDTPNAADAAARGIELLPQPVIACIEGESRDTALAISLCADIRIADESASFGCTAISLGHLPPAGMSQRLARAIGRGRASMLLLLGERLSAHEALAWGLVSGVVADGGSRARARAIAERISAQGPLAMRYAKEAIRQGLDMPLEQALRYETDLTIILQTTDDRAEGVRAFLEKRPPSFTGS